MGVGRHRDTLAKLRGGIGIAAMVNVTDGEFCGKYGKGAAMVQIGGYDSERHKNQPQALEEFLKREVTRAKLSGARVAVNFGGGDIEALLQFADAFGKAGGDYLEYNAHTSTPSRLARGLGYAHLRPENREGLYRVARRLVERSSVPLIVKGRVNTPGKVAERIVTDFGEIARELERIGAAGFHLNIRKEAKREADLEVLGEVRAKSDIFLLASGYVGLEPSGEVSLEKAAFDVGAFQQAGADLVMVGQAALDSPEVISSLAARLAEGP